MRAFASLPIFFAIVIFLFLLLYYLYTPYVSAIKPLSVIYDSSENTAEFVTATHAAIDHAISLYRAASLLVPDTVQADIESGAPILKEAILLSIIGEHQSLASTYYGALNRTCFCSPYSSDEFSSSSLSSARTSSLVLPGGAEHIGDGCSQALSVYILNYSPTYYEVEVSFASKGYRFACLSQNGPFSHIELVPEKVTFKQEEGMPTAAVSLDILSMLSSH
ncbi:MAG: hypothetical protein D6769_00820 [Methanobacteriota archaeon]|nr:MAG: hypothetical protein D6769_00820 [Euryarchaeota archaeon]